VAVASSGLTDATKIRPALSKRARLRASGSVGCWGYGGNGEIVDGAADSRLPRRGESASPMRPNSGGRSTTRAPACWREVCGWGIDGNGQGELATEGPVGSSVTVEVVGLPSDPDQRRRVSNVAPLRGQRQRRCWG